MGERVGGRGVGRGVRRRCGIGVIAAAAEHVPADHLDQIDRRRGERDLLARLQRLHVATRRQADVALAEQAAGEDRGRGVDRDLVEAVLHRQRHDGIEAHRIEIHPGHPADRHAADLDRRVRTQLAEIGEARGEFVRAAAREAELAGLGRRLDADQTRLLGLDAGQELVTRAAEFADAMERLPALAEAAQVAASKLEAARADVAECMARDKADSIAAAERNARLGGLAHEIEQAGRQMTQERQLLVQRILEFRRRRAQMPPAWRGAAVLRAAREEFESANAVRRELERLDTRLATGGFVEDEGCIALRDKFAADHAGMEAAIGQREAHLHRARRITEEARGAYLNVLRATVRRYRRNLVALGELAGIGVDAEMSELVNDDVALAQAGLTVRFDFDRKGWIGLDDGEASGGQQVMKSLLLLVALLRDEDQPGGFVFIDEPFAHLDVANIEKVGRFLRSTDAQYILTTPITHNINVFEPSDLVLATSKRRPQSTWADPVAILKRDRTADAA